MDGRKKLVQVKGQVEVAKELIPDILGITTPYRNYLTGEIRYFSYYELLAEEAKYVSVLQMTYVQGKFDISNSELNFPWIKVEDSKALRLLHGKDNK